jgi:hypothetical protein
MRCEIVTGFYYKHHEGSGKVMQVSFDAEYFTEKPRCETCLYWDRYNGQGVCEKTDEKKWPGDVCEEWSQ